MTLIRPRDEDVLWQDVDDAIVVLDLRSSQYISLGGAGTLLWRRIAEGASLAELQSLLVDEFGIDRGEAVQDVAEFISDLDSAGLIGPT